MPKKKPTARDAILSGQSTRPRRVVLTDQLTGELRDVCDEARALYRQGKVSSKAQLYRTLVSEFGYPYGQTAFLHWLQRKDDGDGRT